MTNIYIGLILLYCLFLKPDRNFSQGFTVTDVVQSSLQFGWEYQAA